jgi:hypothetical protein
MISRRVALAIPLVAVILVGGLYYYYFTSNSGTIVMSIQPGLILKESYYGPGGFVSQYFVTSANIGNPGGIISNTTFLSDGVNGFYPLYTTFPPCGNVTSVIVCSIHVQSKVVRPYTLGDFFNVWGEPLGRNNTLGYKANVTGTAPFYWDMCIYDISAGRAYPSLDWASHVLKDGEIVLLLYSQIGCL